MMGLANTFVTSDVKDILLVLIWIKWQLPIMYETMVQLLESAVTIKLDSVTSL